MRKGWRPVLAVASVIGVIPQGASACGVCFGKSDAAMAQGMNMGILSLLGVIVFVLLTVAAFFVYLVKRSAAFSETPPAGDWNEEENFAEEHHRVEEPTSVH